MRGMKKALITASILTVVGLLLFVGIMSVYRWDFTRLSTEKMVTESYEVNENFSNIAIHSGSAEIRFAASDDGKCKVLCTEWENAKHSVTVENDTLTINSEDSREWYDHIGIYFDTPQVTVYLPQTSYNTLLIREASGDIEIPSGFRFGKLDLSLSTGDVKCTADVSGELRIETSTGDIRVENCSADDVTLSVSTGAVTVSEVKCTSLRSEGSTGNVLLKNADVAEKISVERSTGDVRLADTDAASLFIRTATGDVRLENADADEIYIQTTTGDVSGHLLSDKVFLTETATGTVRVPKTAQGGKCEIITITGDILFED